MVIGSAHRGASRDVVRKWRTITRVIAASASAFALSGVAYAWDGVQTLVPGVVDVTDGGNYGFRVWGLSCGGAENYGFGYLNNTDSNYSTYVAVILMSKAAGTPVTFYLSRDTNGFCQIGYISQE